MKLIPRLLIQTVIGLPILGAFIFVPAGTLDYWQGWTFLVVFTVSSSLLGLYLAIFDPALLERRIKAGPRAETRPVQKIIMSLAFASMFGLLIFSAFDYRFGWSPVPMWVSILGNLLVVVGLAIDLQVFRENSYAASTIQIMAGQKIISTGLYGLVRHPMYLGALIMVLGMPLALDSYWGLLLVLVNFFVFMLRIFDEEKMLRHELAGYEEYTHQVRYRLVPGVW